MIDVTELVHQYIEVWNETDPTARRAAVERLWEPTGSYVDPIAEAQGHDQIAATIGAVQEQFAGFDFSLHGDIDAHHGQARFQWALGPAGAEPVVIGFDVLVTGRDGRIQSVLGFLDRVPSGV